MLATFAATAYINVIDGNWCGPMNHVSPLRNTDAALVSDAPTARPPARGLGARIAAGAAAFVLLVFVGYGAIWAVAGFQLRGGVLDWIEAREAEGYRVAYSGLGLGGFPFAARVTLAAPVVTAPDGRALGWSWAGDRAAVEASPLRPNGLTIKLAGEEALSVNVAGKLKTYRGHAEEFTLFTGGEAATGRLTVRGLAMAAEEPGDAIGLDQLTATGSFTKRMPPAEPDTGYVLNLSGAGLRLPRALNLPLGNTISHIAADATVIGSAAPSASLHDTLARWRDGGGSVHFSALRFDYGPLSLDGEGTLALDDEAQPVGAFSVRVQGFQQTVTDLAARGIIDDQAASKARIALAFLAGAARQGVPATVKVPLAVRDRLLSVGSVPLLKVPEIEWPRGPYSHAG